MDSRGLAPGDFHGPPWRLGETPGSSSRDRPHRRGCTPSRRPLVSKQPANLRPRAQRRLSRTAVGAGPELCSRRVPALSSSLEGMAGSARDHRPAGPHILRAGGGEDGRALETFPSIVPSLAPSNCDKLLRALTRPGLGSLLLERGENTAYGICHPPPTPPPGACGWQSKAGEQTGLPDPQVSDRRGWKLSRRPRPALTLRCPAGRWAGDNWLSPVLPAVLRSCSNASRLPGCAGAAGCPGVLTPLSQLPPRPCAVCS